MLSFQTTIAAHRESLQSGDMTDESFIGIVTVDVGTLRCAWSLSCGDFLIPPDPDVKLQVSETLFCALASCHRFGRCISIPSFCNLR
jgi:hypothetical protein